MKAASKRGQSGASTNFAEQEQARGIASAMSIERKIGVSKNSQPSTPNEKTEGLSYDGETFIVLRSTLRSALWDACRAKRGKNERLCLPSTTVPCDFSQVPFIPLLSAHLSSLIAQREALPLSFRLVSHRSAVPSFSFFPSFFPFPLHFTKLFNNFVIFSVNTHPPVMPFSALTPLISLHFAG